MLKIFKNFFKEWKEKKLKEKIYMLAGVLALGAAIVGVFLPLVPQVPFAILAAFFFSKGSRRLHRWTRENRFFGKAVEDWEDDRIVRPKLKVISTIMMVGGAAVGHWRLSLTMALILDAIFLVSILFVVSRKSSAQTKQ